MTAAQVREIGVAADAFAEGPEDSPVFGNRYADLTTRQDIQLHWIRIADVPRIWQRFWDVGLTTVQACGDSARNVCSCPASGIDHKEVVEALPVAGPFRRSSRETGSTPISPKVQDRRHRLHGRLRAGGDQRHRAVARRAGRRNGRFQRPGRGRAVRRGADGVGRGRLHQPDQAVELCRGVAQVFGELGNRENRGLARMRYLVQELGPEGFRAELDERTNFALQPAGRELTTAFRGDHVGVHPQRQPGLFYVGCSVPVGRMHGIELVELARLAETYGDGGVRIGTDQNFIVSGVPEDRLDDLLAEPLMQTYTPFPGPFERASWPAPGRSSAVSRWWRPRNEP